MSCHRIALKGPWEVWFPADDGGARRVTMPQSWKALFGEAAGTAKFERRFHRPSGLAAEDTVWVVLTGVRGRGNLSLNREPVGTFDDSSSTFRFDVTELLIPFNCLTIQLEFSSRAATEDHGLYGPVLLEILPQTSSSL